MKIKNRIVNSEAKYSKAVAALNAESGHMPIAEASISANGDFEMNLPDIVLGYSYLSSPANICDEIKFSPESLKIAVIDAFWLFDPQEAIIGYIFQGSTQASIKGRLGEEIVLRWYANQNSLITGSASCGPHGVTVDFKLSLKKGWNDVVRHFHSDSEASIHTSKNINSMRWYMALTGDRIKSINFLKSNQST